MLHQARGSPRAVSRMLLSLQAPCPNHTRPVTGITCVHLEATLYNAPPSQKSGQRGRPRRIGARHPSLHLCRADLAPDWTARTLRGYDGTDLHRDVGPGGSLEDQTPGHLCDPHGQQLPRPCLVPTPTCRRHRLRSGAATAGRSRSRARPCVSICTGIPDARGRTWPSRAPHRPGAAAAAGLRGRPDTPNSPPPGPMSSPGCATPSGAASFCTIL